MIKKDGVKGLHVSRRTLLKKGALISGGALISTSPTARATSEIFESQANATIVNPTIGFHSYVKSGHLAHSLKSGRLYNVRLMQFMQLDSFRYSPFGSGGVHGYAFANSNPANMRDPSGHFPIISLIIGSVVGFLVGAGVSSISESIKIATQGGHFDWKQVVIGGVVGAISGGFGAASAGVSQGLKGIAAIADSIVSGAVEFGLSVASGYDTRQSLISAGTGAAIGLITYGVGSGLGTRVSRSNLGWRANRRINPEYIPMGVISADNPSLGAAPTNVASRSSSISSSSVIPSTSTSDPFPLDLLMSNPILRDHTASFLDDVSLGRLSSVDRNLNHKLNDVMKRRMKSRYDANRIQLSEYQRVYREKMSGGANFKLSEVNELIRNKFHLVRRQRQLIQSWIRQFPSDMSVSFSDGFANII